ncbi:hypothetical protein DENSPDRAFT_879065 [Dentipellis sp. KUC8613]|nr:hypothetical protein DENSPDRAFT_879065 [Dentipellis sp. KUC8613]
MPYVRVPTPGSTTPTSALYQLPKRDRAPAPNCRQLAPWLRLCWIDIVVISIVIATIVYVIWGIPLTIRMWRICRGRPPNTPPGSPIPSPSSSPSASPSPSPSPPSTSPKQLAMPTHIKQRRETVHALHFRTSSLPAGADDEKRASQLQSQSTSAFASPRAPWLRRPSASLEHIPASPPTPSPLPCAPASASSSKDPYLLVNPSLDDSLLLRSGLVAPTARPEPALNAYDTHAPFPSPPPRSAAVPARRHSDAMLPLPTPGHAQGHGLRLSELPPPPPLSPPTHGHGHGRREVRRSYDEGRSSREESIGVGVGVGIGIGTAAGLGLGMDELELVLPPPPAYSQYPIGQGKGRKNPYDAD